MELRINDYVRTKKGIIGKIKLIDNQTELEDLYLVKRKWYYKEDFIKSSPRIIDLIKVGDYVNGLKVQEVNNEIKGFGTIVFDKDNSIMEDYIYSIVTKEQFSCMEYKIGE